MTPELSDIETARLKAALEHRAAARQADAFPPPSEYPVLSDEQVELWVADQTDPHSSHHVLSRAWRLHGPLDAEALERAIAALIARQPALATMICPDAGQPKIFYADAGLIPLEAELLPPQEAEPAGWLDRRMTAFSSRRFDLTQEPASRFRLYILGEADFVLAVSVHHIVCDDFSLSVLAKDIGTLYAAETGPRAVSAALHPVAHDRGTILGAVQANPTHAQAEGRRRMPLQWPVPSHTQTNQTANSALAIGVEDLLSPDETAALRATARSLDLTLYSLCAAAYQVLMARYCMASEVAVGVAYSTRGSAADDDKIGMMISYAGLAADLTESRRIADLGKDFQKELSDIRQGARPNNITGFSATLVRYNTPIRNPDFPGIKVQPTPFRICSITVDLACSLRDNETGLTLQMHGRLGIFNRRDLQALCAAMIKLLRAIQIRPDIMTTEVDLLDDTGRARLGQLGANPAPPDAMMDVVTAFESAAARYPDQPALRCGALRMTYAELAAQTDALAHWFTVTQEMPHGARLGVMLPRGVPMVLATLAGLKAGLVIVPIDPGYPDERLAQILETAAVPVVVCAGAEPGARLGRLCTLHRQFVTRGLMLPPAQAASGITAPALAKDPARPAVIVFTSGSTGRPKGAIIPHTALVRLALGCFADRPGPGDRIAQLASPGFDGAFIELWGALLNGAELVCPSAALDRLEDFSNLLRDHQITRSFISTGVFNLLADEAPQCLSSLSTVMVGGEAMSRPHADRMLATHANLSIVNVYGPTENGALTTSWQVPPGRGAAESSAPIGTPLPGNLCFVLDVGGRLLPCGFAGELWVGGEGLALGYEGQPEVTAEKFRNFSPDRLGLPSGPSLRLYRTGDRARWRSDGSAIDYLGRLDAQVKLNGYRIEPGEIEATMLLAADIRKAVVIPVADGAGGAVTGLTAFFETTTPPVQSGLAESNLRIALSHKLPRFLMPTRFVHMSQGLPLTANGKVDRRALLAAARATSKQSAAPLSGIEPALADLWTELLGQPIVTADADFFLLGGHSLLAIRMLARVEKQFGRLIEVSRFLADARLSKLQEMLWTRAAPASGGLLAPETSRHLVLLRAGDPALAPIICLPGVMGMPVWSHFLLANLTPTRQPMLGLKVDFSEHEDALPQTLQQLAEIFADVICDQWADSECGVTLLGYSIGGFIAAAVASVLEGRNCPPAKVILIDPNTNLAPNPQTPPQQQGAFPRNWLERLRIHHRLQPLKTPMDYIFCTQGFPMPRAEDAEEWAVFAQGGVRVRRLDAFHLSIVQRPWAGMLAECVSDILNDTEMPEKVTTAPWDSARIQLAQEAAEAVYDRRLPDALTNLDQIAARIRPEPDFLFIQRVRLMAATGARMRLASAALRRILSPQPFRPALWGPLVAVLDRVGMARIGDLAVWRGMHGAGGLRGCGFLGVYRLVQRRKFKAAASLLARFEYTPGLEIETLLAQAIMARRGGQQGTAYSLIAKALARSDAGLPHFDTAIRQILDRSDRAFILDLLAAASDLFRDDPVVLTLRKAWEQYIADPAMPEPWLDDDLAPQQQA
jgi:amino acid adenylation domain-containing protein